VYLPDESGGDYRPLVLPHFSKAQVPVKERRGRTPPCTQAPPFSAPYRGPVYRSGGFAGSKYLARNSSRVKGPSQAFRLAREKLWQT